MKILLDESLPRKLIFDFGSAHDVRTVRDAGWLSIKNGALLTLMVEEGFDMFVTADRNLQYQQNISRFNIVIVVLIAKDNKRDTLSALIPKLLQTILQNDLPQLIEIF